MPRLSSCKEMWIGKVVCYLHYPILLHFYYSMYTYSSDISHITWENKSRNIQRQKKSFLFDS